ncbi:MAG: prepilin peptidase [Clostridiales bacterium]|jgi:leader peptidase (prepilin peptidase)/N-methyltransferase|nr:prepilin peptidase [Clostridiales bacterium]HQA47249.1 A24 family peptidase [Bacillota bacterium]HQD41582.1 A24 family peptidase [Bacillota bacterium]
MEYAAYFVLGLVVGGFINKCIHRIQEGKSVLYPPSRCRACGRPAGLRYMEPAANYVFLNGKCRYCGDRIPPVFPVVELATAALYIFAFYRFGNGIVFFKSLVLMPVLLVAAIIDLKEQIIPDSLVVFGLVSGTLFALAGGSRLIRDAVLGAAAGGGILLVIVLVSKGGMGWGDVKLSTVIGLFLGWQSTLVALYISFISGGVVSLLLLFTGKKGRKDPVPFGPFLSGSAALALLFGQRLFSFWLPPA